MKRRSFLPAFLLSLAVSGAALAQAPYPAKPVRFVVPFPPGTPGISWRACWPRR
jgi:tripartite-type tricarboxylate transporter receptor subunit TctC